jgi:chemotaxis protein CheD
MKLRAAHAAAPAPPRAAPTTLATSGVVEPGKGAPAVFLRPGDWMVGGGPVRASTLLGSCVALMLWSPRVRVGAMCHCLLPRRQGGPVAYEALDGRFGEEAARWIEGQLGAVGVALRETEVTLAGGARVRNGFEPGIGESNLDWAWDWIARSGMALVQQDVGGRVVRRVGFNLTDGSVTVAHGGVVTGAQE